ncbi:MAG TPA: glycosyltransferase family 9 protein [candidate division Zixibacteria bacterium]|nr:glycosyltransferase family 9 protein [candidate division Zixibacteria bacterium]
MRLDEIGDVVMTTPFLRELRRNAPNAWITLIVKPELYNLVELCPHVNQVLTFSWQGQAVLEPLQRHWRALNLARQLTRKRRFDLAIIPRWDVDWYHSTFLVYASGARERVAYSEKVNAKKEAFNREFDKLLTRVLVDRSIRHEVQQNLNMIRALGGEVGCDEIELWLARDDERFADELLEKHGVVPGRVLIGIGPGAGAQKREWPVSLYAELGAWAREEFGATLLIIGGTDDQPKGYALQQVLARNCIDITGRTTLRQLGALLRRCTLYVGNDAGPMHLAAAAGIPVVGLFCHPKGGSAASANSPTRFRPWCARSVVVQPPAARPPCVDECVALEAHCILGIRLEDVKGAVFSLMSERHVGEGGVGGGLSV